MKGHMKAKVLTGGGEPANLDKVGSVSDTESEAETTSKSSKGSEGAPPGAGEVSHG